MVTFARALLIDKFGLVKRKVVKGERKDHRWAGSSSDSTCKVDPDTPRLRQVRYRKLLDIPAFGYINNEDHRLAERRR
jgi:hypothetical protein